MIYVVTCWACRICYVFCRSRVFNISAGYGLDQVVLMQPYIDVFEQTIHFDAVCLFASKFKHVFVYYLFLFWMRGSS
jgi:hypothetical protein